MSGNVWLTDLADACRKSGLEVIEVPGWKTRSAAPSGGRYGGPALDAAPRSITVHHTATNAAAPGDYPTYKTILTGNSQTGGPLSQLGLGRSGKVYVFAAGICWHAGRTHDPEVQGNRFAIGIEGENPGDGTPWPQVQYDAFVRLCAALADHYAIPVEHVLGHKEISLDGKIDPRFDMDPFRSEVAQVLGSGAVKSAPIEDTTPTGFTHYAPIAEDGQFGAESTRTLQGLLGTAQDGIISGQREDWGSKYFPAFYSLEYGDGGSDMVFELREYLSRTPGATIKPGRYLDEPCARAIQKWLGITQDGFVGPATVTALQKRLNAITAKQQFMR